jgi:L-lactate dehydrogenase
VLYRRRNNFIFGKKVFMLDLKKARSKVVVVGSGFVGSSAAFAMSINQLCSELVLIDINNEKSMGEAMDINHGLPFLGQMTIYAGDYSDCKDADVIVITAGANRKPGETRIDLAKKNVMIVKEITANIKKHYTGGVILVISNPVDILTYLVAKWMDLPEGRVIGSGTVLDSARFRSLLSQKFNIDVKNVHGYIIGEHGDTQFPAWSATHIAGLSIDEYCKATNTVFTDEDRIAIADEVRKAGASIIQNKGATYYGIAIAINIIVESLLRGNNTIRTVGTVMNGAYGIHDIAFSIPCIVGANGVEKALELALTPQEETLLYYSAEQVKIVLNQVKDL